MSGFFDNRFKLSIHLIQLGIALAVVVLSVIRMLNQPPNAPKGRSNTMALGMAAKSIVIILYEVLSEHIHAAQKWSSLKVYTLLNVIETGFWAAVVVMLVQANLRFCGGLSCTLSWIIVTLGVLMSTLAAHMVVVCWLDFRHLRTHGTHRGRHFSGKHLQVQSTDSISLHAMPNNSRYHPDWSEERLYPPKSMQAGYAYNPSG